MKLMQHTENQTSKPFLSMYYPRGFVNQVPKSISKRLTALSKNNHSFNRVKNHYNEVLSKGGHTNELKYNASKGKQIKRESKNVLHITSFFVYP